MNNHARVARGRFVRGINESELSLTNNLGKLIQVDVPP